VANLTDRELVAIIDAEFESAMGADGGEISNERALAWDYYLSKPLGNEIEGQSKVVTSDVADVVDGIMPSLLRIFTTADNLVSFDPVGPEDMAGAEQESDYVNYVFFKQNPAFLVLYTWFFDALVQKNGIVKAWWDESEVISTESYEGLTPAELASLLNDDELEAVSQEEAVIETVDETGQLVIGLVYNVEFRRTTMSGRVRVEVVPPDEYRISADANSLDPTNARMEGHERDVTRSELIEMGFDEDLIDGLPASGSNYLRSSEQISRKDKEDEQEDTPHDRSQETVRLREAYIRLDYDGDGRSELRQVFTAGNHVLSNEAIDRKPFHCISPQPLPHKHFGRATAEKVMDVQQVNTTLLRQTLDNLYHTGRPGHAVWEQGMTEDTLDDLLTTQVGRVARFARPVNESYSQITVPFTGNHSFAMMEYFDKVKRDRTGINADGEGLSPEALKNIQSTVLAQAVDLSKMKVEAVARIFAETGIKSLFLHIHELVQKHQQKAQIVRLRNQWVQVDPQQWRTRSDMTVNIGLGIGTREQNLLHLDAIWAKQKEMMELGQGNLTVKPIHLFNTAAEIVKNANLKQPEMFFANPGKAEGPPPNKDQMQLQQQQQELVKRQQMLDEQKRMQDQQKIEIQRQSDALQHQREMLELKRKTDADADKFTLGMEQVRNKLTEMELASAKDVPGSRV